MRRSTTYSNSKVGISPGRFWRLNDMFLELCPTPIVPRQAFRPRQLLLSRTETWPLPYIKRWRVNDCVEVEGRRIFLIWMRAIVRSRSTVKDECLQPLTQSVTAIFPLRCIRWTVRSSILHMETTTTKHKAQSTQYRKTPSNIAIWRLTNQLFTSCSYLIQTIHA